MISVLFVNDDSVYKHFPVDCWDQHRDARNFTGDNVIIAHPPCRLWSQLRAFSTAPAEEKELAPWAVELAKKNGGIVEHPAASSLWKVPGLTDDTVLVSVDQHWWNYPARKKTLLLIVGLSIWEIPPMPLNFNAVEKVIDNSRKGKASKGCHVPKSMRSTTTKEFATWLIRTAQLIEGKKTM